METIVAAVFGGLAALLGVAVPGWIALRKMRHELTEKTRDGVLKEWRDITDTQGKKLASMNDEIMDLRRQITALYTENSEMRRLLIKKDDRATSQATQVEKLQTAVTLLKDSPNMTEEAAVEVAKRVVEVAERAAGKVVEVAEKAAAEKASESRMGEVVEKAVGNVIEARTEGVANKVAGKVVEAIRTDTGEKGGGQ